MTIHSTIVADVFTQTTQAQRALEALKQAGFGYDQIGIAMQGHEGIDLFNDLLNLGLSHEQANYYSQEVKAGRIVVSVRPDGREQEAHNIMLRSGSANTDASTVAPQTDIIDKQRVAWDLAVASQEAQLSNQMAMNMQDDFHRPRSLKPREEREPVTTNRVQTEAIDLRPDMVTSPQPSVVEPVLQNEVVTPQQPGATAPVMQNEVVRQQQPNVVEPVLQNEVITPEKLSANAPAMQNEVEHKQLPLLAEQKSEDVSIDDEETLRRFKNKAKSGAGTSMPPVHTRKNWGLKGMLLGALLPGLALGVVVALRNREEILSLIGEGVRRVQHMFSQRG